MGADQHPTFEHFLLTDALPHTIHIANMASSNSPCTLTLDDGTHYDLSSLSSAKADYTATVGEREFKLNVCRAVVSELWSVDQPELVGGFIGRQNGDFSIG
jgi:cation-dependent mannose-6-phosphate receptor